MILVTGGTGYIGRALVEELTKRHHARILTRRDVQKSNCEIAKGDVTNLENVKRAIRGCDVVVHLAASKDHTGRYSDVSRINVEGTINVLLAAEEEGVKRVVYGSSVAADEDIYTPYSLSKAVAEGVTEQFRKSMTIPILRFAPIYDRKRLEFLRKWKIIPVVKDLRLHLVHLDAVAKALCMAVERGGSRVYTIADRTSFLSQELPEALGEGYRKLIVTTNMIEATTALCAPIEAICRLFGLRPPVTPNLIRAYSQDRKYDISSAVKDLQYRPVDTLKTFHKLLS